MQTKLGKPIGINLGEYYFEPPAFGLYADQNFARRHSTEDESASTRTGSQPLTSKTFRLQPQKQTHSNLDI